MLTGTSGQPESVLSTMRKSCPSPAGDTSCAVTDTTRASGGASSTSRRRSSAMHSASPSTSMSTPALSFCTEPASRRATACRYTNGRKPTPCTVPVTRSRQRATAPSADPGKGIADEHVDDPGAAERREEHDETLRVGSDLADGSGVGAERLCAQRREGSLGLVGRHNGDDLALVG